MTEAPVICPTCKATGEASRVTVVRTSTTCMAGSPAFYDERGALQPGFDPNTTTTDYRCSLGHIFATKRGWLAVA